jgi:hypothetical protein
MRRTIIGLLLLTAPGCAKDKGSPDADLSPAVEVRVDGKKLPDAQLKSCGLKIGAIDDPATGDNTDFLIGGTKRRFYVLKVNVPAAYSGKLPVVFVYGGYYSTSVSFNKVSPADPANKPFLKIVPQSLSPQALPVWDFTSDPDQSADVRFFDEMIACLQAQIPIDTDRIHAVGSSAGGWWVDYLATHRGDVLASFAPISGGVFSPADLGYSFLWPVSTLLGKLTTKPAALVTWGGPTDEVDGFSFHDASLESISLFRSNAMFAVRCMYDVGHAVPLESHFKFVHLFFEDHPRSVSPEPYAAGLPKATPFSGADKDWPSLCSVAP